MKKILVLLGFLCIVAFANAQTPLPHHRQFFYNPYLFNPAYVTQSKDVKLSLAYRTQWMGFKDAPSFATMTAIVPLKKQVSLGFYLHSNQQVLVDNTVIGTTFGYSILLSKKSSLNFGISGGFGVNHLDLTAEELNTNDPVITRSSPTNYYVDGNVGFLYVYDKLKVGAAINGLFNNEQFYASSFTDVEFSKLRNRMYMVSYSIPVGKFKRVDIEPYAYYQESSDDYQDYYEFGSTFYLDQKYWIGAGYNNYQGIAGYMGINLDKFGFSYAYEFPTLGDGVAGGHELMMSFTIPHKNKKKGPVPTPKPIPKPVAPIVIPAKEVEQEPMKKIIVEEQPKENITYYVVIAVFKDEQHVDNYINKQKLDYEIAYLQNPANDLFYVYIASRENVEEAKQIREEVIKNPEHKAAWILSKKN